MHGDLASYRDASDFVRGLDVVIHLAHTNTPLTSNDDLPSDAAMNLGPTLTLIQAVRSSPGRCHVVFSSSGGAVYGPPNDARRALTEDDPCEPVNSYGIQKLMGEHYLRLAADEGWLTATVLRIGNAYGVALPRERGQGFLGVAMADHARQMPVRVFGAIDNVRDYVHLDDVSEAFERSLEPSAPYRVYNIGSGKGTSVRDLLDLLERVSGRRVVVERETLMGADRLTGWVVLNSERATTELRLEANCRA